MKCCTHQCNQGRDCPARLAQAATEKAAATSRTPGHYDASDQHPKFIDSSIDDFLNDTGWQLLQGLAMAAFVVSLIVLAWHFYLSL